jgi:hypothetical protein
MGDSETADGPGRTWKVGSLAVHLIAHYGPERSCNWQQVATVPIGS